MIWAGMAVLLVVLVLIGTIVLAFAGALEATVHPEDPNV